MRNKNSALTLDPFCSVRVQTLEEKLRKAEEGRARAEAAALSWKNAYESKGPLGLW